MLCSDPKETRDVQSHTMKQKVGGNTLFKFTADKIEFNVEEINEAFFAFPKKEKE